PEADTSVDQTGARRGIDPKLDAEGFLLDSTSGAIDRGTNDPLGQGANSCSLNIAGETIDCTKDIQGQSRTADGGWDIGADEYSRVGAGGGSELAGGDCRSLGFPWGYSAAFLFAFLRLRKKLRFS